MPLSHNTCITGLHKANVYVYVSQEHSNGCILRVGGASTTVSIPYIDILWHGP